jgi:hypothetical protein
MHTFVLVFFIYLACNHADYSVRRRSKTGCDRKKNLRHLVLFHTWTRISHVFQRTEILT